MQSEVWYKDRWFWGALALGLLLRALPMLIWGWDSTACVRDECIYRKVAEPILTGEGLDLAPNAGWLPAPGMPYAMAAAKALTGRFEAIKWVHWLLTLPLLAFGHQLARQVFDSQRLARAMAFGLAVHPTFVFFTGTMWTETIYSVLLLGTVVLILMARERSWKWSAAAGVLLGLTILNRGIATYTAPLFLLTLIAPDPLSLRWSDWRPRVHRHKRAIAAFVAATVLTVAPYSISASKRWGGMVVTDATLGHVAYLANNDFPPVTFDYGIGQLTGPLYGRTRTQGRPSCPKSDGPLAEDRCEVGHAVEWVRAHPVEFLERIPMRLAQYFNPNSFLTRHLRWNMWPGIPYGIKEALVTFQVASSVFILGLGTIGAALFARGPFGLLFGSVVGYNLAVISCLYGITRFRLPLEPMWMLFAFALVLVRPSIPRDQRTTRVVLAVVLSLLLAPLLGRYLLTGYPQFW